MGMFIMLKQRITLLRINELVLIGYFIAATVMWVWILSDWSEEGVRSRSGNVSRHGAWGGTWQTDFRSGAIIMDTSFKQCWFV